MWRGLEASMQENVRGNEDPPRSYVLPSVKSRFRLFPKQLCKALETFVVLYGHAQVPNTFEVPRDPSWPEETWDVKLGRSLVNIVSKVQHVCFSGLCYSSKV